MSKTFKVPFAFDGINGVVDISNAKKGVIYKCNCGADVKLRGGDIISDHFYHIDESECSLESAIHKAYKEVFLISKKIKLPYVVNGDEELVFDKIELEKKIDDYIPDAIGYIGGTQYLIEFAKSSYIGERKRGKIKKSNLFCLEVDIIKTIDSIDGIKNHLISDKSYKHIIHIPEYKEMKELRDKFKTEYYKLLSRNKESESHLITKINDLESQLESFNEIKEDCGLFYKTDCKNGAKMYVKNLSGYGRQVIGFQKNGVINIKFNI